MGTTNTEWYYVVNILRKIKNAFKFPTNIYVLVII